MQQHNMNQGSQLANYFMQKMQNFLSTKINKTLVVWEDLFDSNIELSQNTVIEVWKSHQEIQKIVKAGFRSLIAYGWYLSYQIPIPGTSHPLFYDTWIDFYENDPIQGLSLSKKELALVLGGEAAMWGEQCDSQTLDQQIWPRTAAIGERLWSPQSVNDIKDATRRMNNHSCRLKQRQISSTPLLPGYCLLP